MRPWTSLARPRFYATLLGGFALLAVAVVIATVAVVASAVPARRASRVDPVRVLRP
jgi:ABC-type antimicrobial peptide transport system permease subunit